MKASMITYIAMVISYVEMVTLCPYMVSLMQSVQGAIKLCGGTVLTQTLTLTAAHCLLHEIKGLRLKFGSFHLFRGGFIYEATKVISHQNFDSLTLAHDIGLVSIFPAFVSFGYFIQPVTIPKPDLTMRTDDSIRIYGWGAVADNESFSSLLRTARLPIIDKKMCQTLLDGDVPEETFCLGYPDGHIDACLGDSGGPAMLHGIQVGITSFGEGCAVPFKPGVYTDLTKYIDWLQMAILLYY